MKSSKIIYLVLIISIVSCKSGREFIEDIKEISYYTGNIRYDKNLLSLVEEGFINNENKTEKTESFKYYQYYYADTKDLVWLEYIEETDLNLKENFFYKDDKLIYAESYDVMHESDRKVVFVKDGQILFDNKSDLSNAKELVEKGNQFLTEFNKKLVK